jgi:integrase
MYEPGYTLHTTRHSFATAMANKPNVDIRAVQDILGHSSLETTMRYVHTSDQRKDYAINQINIGNNL